MLKFWVPLDASSVDDELGDVDSADGDKKKRAAREEDTEGDADGDKEEDDTEDVAEEGKKGEPDGTLCFFPERKQILVHTQSHSIYKLKIVEKH